jgi:type IX secretion system PorP/SprF family membrane protein
MPVKNKMMKFTSIRILITGAACLFLNPEVNSQDIHFSQYWMTPLVQNPAHAGSEEHMRTILNYRDQWKSIGTPYRTINASFDMALSKLANKTGFWAAGIQLFNDKAGESEMGQFQANLHLAYHVNVGEYSTLGAGLMAGYTQRTLNYDGLKWGSQFDGYSYNSGLPAGLPSGTDKLGYADLGAGLLWKYKKGERYMTGNDQRQATLGFSVFHPHKPDYSFNDSDDKLNMKMVIHGDLLIGIPNTNFSVLPGFIYYSQGKLNQLNAGAQFRYLLKQESTYTGFESGKALSLGAHFRAKDAFIASILMELGPLHIGVSYDFNVSALENASSGRGGYEIGLKYMIDNPLRKGSARRY